MRRVASTAAEEAVLEEEDEELFVDDDEELVAIGRGLGDVIVIVIVVVVIVVAFSVVLCSIDLACPQLRCRRGSCILSLYKTRERNVFTKGKSITRDFIQKQQQRWNDPCCTSSISQKGRTSSCLLWNALIIIVSHSWFLTFP
jgi:hypothetical protein